MAITNLDLATRFAFHPATGGKASKHESVRSLCYGAAVDILELTPESREQSLAVTHLEEAMMWANAAIARYPEPGDSND